MPGPEDLSFDAVSAVHETEDPAVFGASIHPLWAVGDKANGGYLLALLGRAARLVAQRHLKLGLCAPEGRGQFDAIAFNHVDALEPAELPAGVVRLVYRLDSNEYMGERRLQFIVEHLLQA